MLDLLKPAFIEYTVMQDATKFLRKLNVTIWFYDLLIISYGVYFMNL